ncbi:uncharacterized protein LOC133195501 [Saccostrea echinata]|uniref:uncharacterized protein LOC133195501 n=1 Tax=Saccostrea echinata TaxID=191078 RepID=UPI002A83C62E|nr:uncharacterized protein LOC133195501 [Saccostrea echinata]XP_061187343.1 uncharacterized protein LOC133195501 [Saccostrea echinata]
MGSAPSEIHKYLLLLDLLKSQHVPFVNTHTVVIQRGSSGKLGIKLKVQNIGESDTFCIVTEVKPVCRLVSGSHLTQFECVVSINGNDVRGLTEDQVFGLIDSIQDYTITLVVCDVLKNNKRTRSQLSNSSESSNSMEVRKKISGMRRMIKSNSVENDEKESSEHDSLLAGEQRVGSQVDQHFNTASCYEERVCSVPVMTERHPVEEEHYHSMPVGSGVCKECKNNNCTGHNHVNLTNKGGNSWAKSVGFVGSYEDLFKYPHRVKWDCLTKAVDLKTSSQGKFGFSYKVKEFKNNADDWYTLVTSVTEDGPADGKLMVGDWIRSIDGHALANPKEALFLEKKLERLREVKVVFQRPEGMLPRHKSFQTGHRPDIVEPNPPHSPISAPTMLTDITGQPVKSNVPLPGSCSPVNAKVGGRSDGYIHQPSTMSKSSVSSTFSSGSCEPRQVKPKQGPSTLDPSSRFTIRPISPGAKVEHVQIFVPGLQSADGTSGGLDDFQMKVKFPKVRIFICGTNARQLSQLLLPNFLLPTDNTVRLFDRVFATMAMERSGEVGFEPWSQYDRLLQIDERARHASNDSLNQCDTSDRSYPSSVGCGAINTEIFIVYDEKFFLQCCQYLFTRTSVFLLSFDGDKMLKSPPCEIHRLQNTIHTIRGAVGYECPIQTYGLLGVDSSDIASTATIDEVRTLFYTSHGNQIVKYNVPRHPHLFHMANGARPNVEVQTSVWRFISEIQEKQYILLISMAMIHQLEQRRQNDVACIDEDDFTATFQETVPGADLGIRQVVWTELLEFGEILSTKAALLPVSSISQLDKLLFIRPDILLDRIHQLQTISPRIIQSNEAIKQIWLKLIASGFFLQSDWSEICPQTDLYSMSSMKLQLSPDKVLLLLQAFGLIFRQEAIDGSHYFIPCFIPEPVYSEKTFEYTTGSLYFQLRGNPPHISSMIYFHLVFRLNNASDARSLVVTNSITCVIHHAGYEITLIHEKLRDRIQIQLNRLEKNVRLHAVLDWLTEICKSSLGSEVKYVLGPACPLQEKCSYAQHTRKNSEELHVLDLAEGLPIFCGNIKVDNQVKVWLKPSKKQQSGRHELLPHQDTETGSNESYKSFETPGPAPLYIKSLPYHVFRDVYENLQINVQKDWRCLAGLLGFTVEEILVYETKSEPAKMLLLDLDQTQRMTVKQLVDVLAKPEMQRQDIIEKLSKFLNGV